MDRTIKKYLHDILLAIEEIEFFLSQRPLRHSRTPHHLEYRLNDFPKLKDEVEQLLSMK